MKRREIRERLDACQSDLRDLTEEEAQAVVSALEQDSTLKDEWRAIQAWDVEIRGVFCDVPVPSGLAERLSAAVAAHGTVSGDGSVPDVVAGPLPVQPAQTAPAVEVPIHKARRRDLGNFRPASDCRLVCVLGIRMGRPADCLAGRGCLPRVDCSTEPRSLAESESTLGRVPTGSIGTTGSCGMAKVCSPDRFARRGVSSGVAARPLDRRAVCNPHATGSIVGGFSPHDSRFHHRRRLCGSLEKQRLPVRARRSWKPE